MNLRNIGERKRDLEYDQSLKNPLYLQMNVSVKAVKDFFTSLPQQGLSIFDFGCGAKPYEEFAAENEYIGIDIDKKNIKADLFSNIDDVPVDDCVADIVCSFFVLEHVYNPIDVLSEKFRILKPGRGILFMLVPLYWEEHEQPYDFWRFTQYSLRKMLTETGFEKINIKAINANWAILGMHLARFLSARPYTRFMVPIINRIFYLLDQRSLKKNGRTNVMTYAVLATKSKKGTFLD